jgi:hypothetical protein
MPSTRSFTLLEILIAIVIMVIGITGILALLPTAIKSGNQTIVDTYSSLVTQSVVDAINVGIRESRYSFAPDPSKPNEIWEYFVLTHDGVRDDPFESNLDVGNYQQVATKDFCILLPRGMPNNVLGANEAVMHYPIPLDKFAPRKLPTVSDPNLNDEANDDLRSASDGSQVFQVTRAFQLGRDSAGDIRDEFLGATIVTSGSSSGSERAQTDPYPQYSFSFSLRRARIDTEAPLGKLDSRDPYSESLYEVKVKVFRNFNPELAVNTGTTPIPRNNLPVHEFITLISK